MILHTNDGKPIKEDNPLPVTIPGVGTNGDRLKVDADLSVSDVTVSDVTIKDATDPDAKMKVNPDGSLVVQLTGSNAHIFSVQNATVTAGTRTTISSTTVDVSDYVYVYMQVKRDSAHSYDAIIFPYDPNNSAVTSKSIGSGNNNLVTEPARPGSTGIRVGIENKDSVDHVYTVYLFGLKA